MDGRRILVTGGADFVGSHLADHLLEAHGPAVSGLAEGDREALLSGAASAECDLAPAPRLVRLRRVNTTGRWLR